MPSTELQNLLQLIEQTRPDEIPPLDEQREGFERAGAMFPPPADVTVEDVDATGVRGEWILPPNATDRRAVMYLHGGGYAIGSPATHRRMLAHLAKAVPARVFSVDYRLAPEDPHPAAIEDAVAAYRWLLVHGHDPQTLAMAGDSAGGGLTIATLVALRDAGDPLPAAAVVLSPFADMEESGESHRTNRDRDPILREGSLARFAAWYLQGQDPRQPSASPIHADLGGLPPMLVQVGEVEVLLDDAKTIARRAEEAGVDVSLEVWDEMIHIWQFWAGLVPEADEAIERIAEFLRKHLG